MPCSRLVWLTARCVRRTGAPASVRSGSPSREYSGRLARLALDRDYTGEAWAISAADLGLPERTPRQPARPNKSDGAAAVVTIAVEKVDGGGLRNGRSGSASRLIIRGMRRTGRGIRNK